MIKAHLAQNWQSQAKPLLRGERTLSHLLPLQTRRVGWHLWSPSLRNACSNHR